MKLSLRAKILLLVAGTVLGVAVLALAAVTMLAKREVGRLVRMDVRSTRATLEHFLRERGQRVTAHSRVLVRNKELLELICGSRDRWTLADIGREYLAQLGADRAIFTDGEGTQLADSNDLLPGTATPQTAARDSSTINASADAGIGTALDGSPWTGVVVREGQMVLQVSIPIGNFPLLAGTLSTYTELDAGFAKQLKAGLPESEIAFVRDGQVVGSSVALPDRLPTPSGEPSPVTLGSAGYVALYAPMPDTEARAGLGYVVLRRSASGASLFDGVGPVFGGLGALLVILALCAGAMVARSVTRPLEGVVGAARTLREGRWPDRFEVSRTDEIGLLQQTFNEMTEAVRTGQDRLVAGMLETIQALAAAVDAKDPYTNGRSERVAEYASRLAEQTGLSEYEVKLVHLAGTLHDVGKIGVPDAILNKPGRLTDEERAVMQSHPVVGEQIVRKAPQLSAALPGIRHHHERWDGKGYPDQLAGEEIPLVARLLAIADTFDAMTSDRPYRCGMDREVALEEISLSAGTQLDPELAPLFVAMMREEQPAESDPVESPPLLKAA